MLFSSQPLAFSQGNRHHVYMGRLSDQIREAIEASGTTRYALAKQIGVPESTLSRFMAGKQGLTLATLDKLAEVLGLTITTTIQQAKPPAPTGRRRKKKEGDMASPATKEFLMKAFWAKEAQRMAKDAHENHFPSRRGVWHIADADKLCFYNNNPYAAAPTLRDEEVAEFRKRLKAARIKELAYATYPLPGEESAGYTFAMIVDAGDNRQQELVDWWHEIISASFQRLSAVQTVQSKR
jgi:transcriptional regulator with XRE-family HTH domain